MRDKILNDLLVMHDEKFAKFNASLIPTTNSKNIIGVHTPELKKYAKKVSNPDKFLHDLPHKYYEENNLHGLIINQMKNFQV